MNDDSAQEWAHQQELEHEQMQQVFEEEVAAKKAEHINEQQSHQRKNNEA
jgi:hypothetical protein